MRTKNKNKNNEFCTHQDKDSSSTNVRMFACGGFLGHKENEKKKPSESKSKKQRTKQKSNEKEMDTDQTES